MKAHNSTSANISPIKTVVVLVQENRSFDHMLGWFKSLNPEINGVTGSESNPLSTSDTDPNSSRIQFTDEAQYVDPDPGHMIEDMFEQIFGEPWSDSTRKYDSENGGIRAECGESAGRPCKVSDEWVRAGVFTRLQGVATSNGATSNDTKQLVQGYPQKTIFESLDEAGFSFGIYYQYPPSTLFYRNLRKLKYLKSFSQFDLNFKNHCKEGRLPNYVVIEQRYYNLRTVPANDDHPTHDVSEGQEFIKEVYEALRSSPQWNEMLFLIIYDEHGGYYDHVPTPVSGVPSPDGLVGPEPYNFKFDRLGVRIPAILISPWIEPGTVLHGPSGPQPTSEFEHSSIPATVKKIFNLKEFLTKRDEWAGTFDCVLNRKTPRIDCPVTLSELVRLRTCGVLEVKEDEKLSEFQQELVQLAATLNGDHQKHTYPQQLVDCMTVADAAKYVKEAFNKFCKECEKASENGADENEIIRCSISKTSKSLADMIVSCIVCGD
ncbi:non-specific phospholipase C3-like [Tripterygium wilfordii]|uniref:Non-specific phospholipase C3-like n=1 Tax=Tripterygium wilfordii TaxID=458696 RepID=A0A7J7CMI1_TRIWF|nr:non-specific phospholipase C3-like [Tripterygium wilfordii]